MTTHFQQHVDRLRDVLADFNRDWENDTARAERELRLKIQELEQELQQWKTRAVEAEHKLLDYQGKPMLFGGRTELAVFKKQSPIVQKVIRLTNAMTLLVERGAPEGILMDAGRNILDACAQLAEWRP